MSRGHLTINQRPLKVAFLVRPTESSQFEKAVMCNSSLWGGYFNPIIPVFERRPKSLADSFDKATARELVLGYVDAFDPDVVVPLGAANRQDWRFLGRQIVNQEELLLNEMPYGILAHELFDSFYQRELRFVRNQPLSVLFPTRSNQRSLLSGCMFGSFLPEIEQEIIDKYGDLLQIENRLVDLSDYELLKSKSTIYPIRLTTYQVEARFTVNSLERVCIMVINPEKALDLMDYWNLRALGWKVFPISTLHLNSPVILAYAKDFIKSNSTRGYPHFTLQKGRCVSESDLKAVFNILKEDANNLVMRSWYPRIWDRWARKHDGVDGLRTSSGSKEQEIQDGVNEITIQTIAPKVVLDNSVTGPAIFANEVAFHMFKGENEPLAEVIPSGGSEVANALGVLGLDEWRVSPFGLVHLSRFGTERINFSVPKAEPVFAKWHAERGLHLRLSPAGRIAKQMYAQLGGSYMLGLLANSRILDLLERMAGGKQLAFKTVNDELRRMAQGKNSASPILQTLTEKNVLRLGLEIQCPVCQQRSWHSLDRLDYTLTCEKCLSSFNLPAHDNKELRWSFRGFGPFALPGNAFGVYSVLLTLRFFSLALRGATTPHFSFATSLDNKELEADLGLFFRPEFDYHARPQLVLAECKTNSRFEKTDVDNLERLGQKLPGAILVFSTLKDSLSTDEKVLISKVANRNRNLRYYERNNPVMVLTRTELMASFRLRKAWQEKGGLHESFAKLSETSLKSLCDSTQQLYLGLPPYAEYVAKALSKRSSITVK